MSLPKKPRAHLIDAARRVGVALAGGSLLLVGVAHARPNLPAHDMEAIDRYEVVSYSDLFAPGVERGKAIGVIAATPEEVYRVASDYSHYKDFVPRIFSSTVDVAGKDDTVVHLGAELPWPAGQTWVNAHYAWEKLSGDIYRMRFEMVSGSMKRFVGSLYLEPWPGNRTAITYELVAEPKSHAPKSIVNRGTRRTAWGFVNAIRQRIRDLQIAGYLRPKAPTVAVTAPALPPPIAGARSVMPDTHHSLARTR